MKTGCEKPLLMELQLTLLKQLANLCVAKMRICLLQKHLDFVSNIDRKSNINLVGRI